MKKIVLSEIKDITSSNIHTVLKELNINVAEEEARTHRVGESTRDAIREFQKDHHLTPDGTLNERTIAIIKAQLHDRKITFSKKRAEKIQNILGKLELNIDKTEKNQRIVGESTRDAIKEYQTKIGVPADGLLNEELLNRIENDAIERTFSTKTQIGKLQGTVIRAAKIARLPVQISEDELKSKTLGTSTSEAIKSLQVKYKLPETGRLDKATLEKLNSIAASRGNRFTLLKKPQATELTVIPRSLRLNMTSPKVAEMQKSLSHLGYKIAEKEFKTNFFGKTTRQAVLNFQKNHLLPETGHLDKSTVKRLNKEIMASNPGASADLFKFRIRGSVRDEMHQPKANMVIQVFEKLIDGESAQPLASKKNHLTGFFDITYSPPLDPITGQVKEKYHLLVKLFDSNNQLIDSQIHYNVARIHWVNFNLGGNTYQGDSDFTATTTILKKALGSINILDIKETSETNQVTQLSLQTGLSTDDIMRLILSHRTAQKINKQIPLDAEVFYAFIRQNLPSALPGDLLLGSNNWETIEQLTEIASNGIVFTEESIIDQVIENAVSQNLVSPKLRVNKAAILQEFKNLRNSFTLEKPILIGNGNLKSLLDQSLISDQHYPIVADLFVANKGINENFYKELNTHSSEIGENAIKDFASTIDLGNLTKNHTPTIQFLKNNIGTEEGKKFKSVRDIAKLQHNELVSVIAENGNQIPENIPGADLNEKVNVYASVLKSRAEFLFPAVSLVAAVKKGNNHNLPAIDNVEKFVDEQVNFDFRKQNLDKFVIDNNIQLDQETKAEIKTFQRVNKLTPESNTGKVLIEQGLHSSSQIYFTGKNRLINLLGKKGVDAKSAEKLYEQSKMQYGQVLAKFVEYRPEIHFGNPRAIIPMTITKEEIQETVGDIPNLETLFGSLDFCECEHCQSLLGPSAYFTDLLRFLKEQDSLIAENGNTLSVKDILFDRRPDLGNIKLNCENTNTPMPYIDLVCEILENNIAPQQKNFSFQTTLNKAELRAIPQHIRQHAYNVISKSDFPMSPVFNLFQEESSTYLNFLRVPRYKLMEAFQNVSNPASKSPTDASIAAEYFGISSYETTLISTAAETSAKQNIYWGFDSTQPSVSVAAFMERAKLNYDELLNLLLVKSVNDPVSPNFSVIERPADTCDTNAQKITNLTLQKFDRMHRFIRLWRKTGWKMWELDLLIRNPVIGNNQINDGLLINLKKIKELQYKLNLPVEIFLAFYGNINTDERIVADKPDVKIRSLFDQLFQNPSITNPTDPNFKRPLNNALIFGVNTVAPNVTYNPVPTILSALAINQSEFDILKTKTDNHLSETSISIIFRYVNLTRSLNLSITELQSLLGITNTTDPFSSVQSTLDLIEKVEFIRKSGMSILELDYVLTNNPKSSIGLRNETIVQFIESLRSIISANQNIIDKLTLNDGSKLVILSFAPDIIQPLNNTQVNSLILPLKNVLRSVYDGFKDSKFSVEEVEYILAFDANNSSFSKQNLIKNIKSLQTNVRNVFSQNDKQIVSQIAGLFNISNQQSELLLNKIKPAGETKTLSELLSDKALIAKNPNGTFKEITETNFPKHFKAYNLLHKISILLQRMSFEIEDLEFFIVNHSDLSTLDFAALPLTGSAVPNIFEKWLNLFKFISFINYYPEPEDSSLRVVLNKAKTAASTKNEIHDLLSKLTQWSKDDITFLDTGLSLKHEAGNLNYTNPDLYFRLKGCFSQMKLTGVNAETMFNWADRDTEAKQPDVALQTRLAIKSKYEKEDWLQKITPLQDDLREKKRKALVDFHLENSQRTQPKTIGLNGSTMPNPLYWTDSNSLFKHFLIDCEMSSCQLTSRIKQSISSVQLFVQRCFLNLENRFVQVSQEEKEDVTSENSWAQWKWMKNYRIWEANRKIFFYPENWIEPELRDDKSQFFEELENEILQREIIHPNVEAAYLNYLYKIDEVSHLEVCGMYHEQEELNPHELGYEIDVVHVIAKTKAMPATYYYRKYDMNYSMWSAWEKLDVDIVSDHVLPVVYNRKLHLFWLMFTEKPQKNKKVPPAKATNGPSDSPEPQKTLEVQLAWTIKKEQGWSAKRISPKKLINPWERPHYSYNLKPFYKAVTNELWIDIYLSTSKEFNDGKFYDPFNDKMVNVTANRFNETYLPWHSASFVFDGEVKDVKLKGLYSYFHFEFPVPFSGGANVTVPIPSSSYDYVHHNFGIDGDRIKLFQPNEDGPRLALPNGMHFHNTHLTNNQNHTINKTELRVLENNATVTLLRGALDPFELVITQQDLQFNTYNTTHPLFYQDNQRAFFIKTEWQQKLDEYGRFIGNARQYQFYPFYHPYTVLFLRELNRTGLDGLLNRKIQTKPETFVPQNNFNFSSYQPQSVTVADETAKTDIVDFSFGGAYSIYNWEIFFHAPLMIAARLSQNQRFEEAIRWFHYVFDPTNIEALPTPQRYWVTKPFFEFNSQEARKQRIESILSNLDLEKNKEQLKAWRNNPFKPHLIARYRPVAYMRNVVMKYLDNLIAWGDHLFRRDTIESINEAMLVYMLAYEILGDRPVKVPNVKHKDLSFNEIEEKLDEFGNAKIDVQIEDTLFPIKVVPSAGETEPIPKIETFYFGIPNNDLLLKYWDTVEDRLFKIRRCMNIEGVVRQLPLFEPPIDPALLVKAAAAGVDLNSVLDDIAAGTPHYRFRTVVQKAIEFCIEVISFGDKLLSVIEKRDSETLALLNSSNQIQLLNAISDVKNKLITEAEETLANLERAKLISEEKVNYYTSRDYMNTGEIAGITLNGLSIALDTSVSLGYIFAGVLKAIPKFAIGASGFGGSPHATGGTGGDQFGDAAKFASEGLNRIAGTLSKMASLSETLASYARRKDEWDFQGRLAKIEVAQLQSQINAAQVALAITQRDLENHQLEIENAKGVDEFMHTKFTNKELFNWMMTQISAVYFQAYQLAFDMAKKAEKCFQYELGTNGSSFIKFGYWDSLKQGLLAGEKLLGNLRRLEAAYLDQNKRELELTKHISLAQVDPLNLLKLKETGECKIVLPEWLFNMDYPGHYMRRIKSLSVSIPCVVGPYTSINCTLSLLRNETRINSTLSNGQYARVDENDLRFKTQLGNISSIATSNGQSDSGMFELNFNDDRYLPFEGAGLISEWQINLPRENNYFDFGTISDLILHIKYTSRDGGNQLAVAANQQLQNILPNASARLFSFKHDFPNEFHKFFSPIAGADQEFVLNLKAEHYPFFLRGKISNLKIGKLEIFTESTQESDFENLLKVTSTNYETNPINVSPNSSFNNVHYTTRDYTTGIKPNALGELRMKLRVKGSTNFKTLTPEMIDDMFFILYISK